MQLLDLSENDRNRSTELGSIRTLQTMLLGNTNLVGSVPEEVCAIAADPDLMLDILVVDCAGDPPEIFCEVPACCSGCTPLVPKEE